jgi:hypothetical protein
MRFSATLFFMLLCASASAAETQLQSYNLKPGYHLVAVTKGACLSSAKPPVCTSPITQIDCCADPSAYWYEGQNCNNLNLTQPGLSCPK